ncbi:TetR/AcrR family transcriptional regulator [Monashia sp. NPDC004114]
MPAPQTPRKSPEQNRGSAGRPNRGPAAAAANRAALVEAGRELFARDGYDVPMSAIARAAGVGQGVLYRHFPSRVALALAVFSDNIDELERTAAADDDEGGFLSLWRRIVHQTLESTAFVDLLVRAEPMPDWAGADRLEAIVSAPLARAQAAGLVRADLTAHDVILLQRVIYGVIVTAPESTDLSAEVRRTVMLVDEALGRALDG